MSDDALKTFALPKAYVISGTSYEELAVREATAGTMVRIAGLSGRDLINALAADVCSVPMALIDAIPSHFADDVAVLVAPAMEAFTAAAVGRLESNDLPSPELTIQCGGTICLGGTSWVDHIDLHEPTGKELATSERETDVAKLYVLLASFCSGLPRGAVEKISLGVFTRMVAYLRGFTTAARQGGGN